MTSRRLKPTGFLWLFAHEARLLWRGSILVRTRRHVLVPLVTVALVFQGLALALAWATRVQALTPATLVMIANLNLVFLLFLMLSRAMTSAIDVLYSRGDVDFLLASPIPPSRVLAVRMLGVAAATASPWLLLGGVLANGFCLFGRPAALAAYPMIFGVSLLATAFAFATVVVLVGRVGPRVARTISHALALTIGMLIFLLGQMPRYVPQHKMARFWESFMPDAANAHSLLWVPGRALLGQPAPFAATMACFLLIFLAVLFGLEGRFAAGAINASAFAGAAPRRAGQSQFRDHPFAAAMQKNLRLLLRFPGLLTQTVYRSLTLVPVAMILAGEVKVGGGVTVVTPLLVFLAGQLALFFASVIIGSEHAPDLTGAAPVPANLPRRATTAAALYAATLVMAVPLLGVLLRAPGLVAVTTSFTLAAALSNLFFAQQFPIPLMRPEFGKTQTGSMFGLMLGLAISGAWAMVAYMLVAPHPWGFLKA